MESFPFFSFPLLRLQYCKFFSLPFSLHQCSHQCSHQWKSTWLAGWLINPSSMTVPDVIQGSAFPRGAGGYFISHYWFCYIFKKHYLDLATSNKHRAFVMREYRFCVKSPKSAIVEIPLGNLVYFSLSGY